VRRWVSWPTLWFFTPVPHRDGWRTREWEGRAFALSPYLQDVEYASSDLDGSRLRLLREQR